MPDIATLQLRIESMQAKAASDRLDRLDASGRRAEQRAGKLQRGFKSMSGTAAGLARTLGTVATALGGIFAIRSTVRTLIDFETSLVGVAKTADLTGKELEDFAQSVITLSTEIPATTGELLSIAQAAGQLGVKGRANLLLFSETISKLGNASDLAGDEAATALTRILNVTGESVSNIDKLASVIVALGNSSAASESEIAALATRIAQSTAAFNVSSTEAAALGAALREMGVEAEAGGTAVGRTFRELNASIREGGERLRLLEQVTGLTGDAMQRLIINSPVELFEKFAIGLGKVKATEVDEVMERLGLAGERLAAVLPTVAQNADRLGLRLKTMRDELENTVALENEAARAAETLGSRLTILGNTITAIKLQFRGSTGFMSGLVDQTTEFLKVLFDLDGAQSDASKTMLMLVDAVKGLSAAFAVLLGLAVAAKIAAMAAALAALLNPVGLVIAAIAGITGAFVAFKDTIIEVNGRTVRLGDVVTAVWAGIKAAITTVLDFLGPYIEVFWENIVRGARVMAKFLTPVIEALSEFLIDEFKRSLGFVIDLFKTFAKSAVGSTFAVVKGLEQIISSLVAVIKLTQKLQEQLKAGNLFGALQTGRALVDATDFEKQAKLAKEAFVTGFAEGQDLVDTMVAVGGEAGKSFFDAFNAALDEAERSLMEEKLRKQMNETFGNLKDTIFAHGKALAGAFSKGFNQSDELQGMVAGFKQLGKDFSGGGGGGKGDVAGPDLFGQTVKELEREVELLDLKLHKGERAAELRQREFELQDLITQAAEEDKDLTAEQVEQLTQLVNRRNDLTDALEDQLEQMEKMRALEELAGDIGMAFSNTFERMIFDAQSAGEAFKQLGEELARLIFRQLVLNQIAQGVSGAITSAFTPTTGVANGAAFGQSGIIALANGGVLDKPTFFTSGSRSYVAGEAGPEAVLPLRRGPGGKLGVESQAPTVNVIINNESGSRAEVTETRDGSQRNIMVQIKDEVARDIRSNGNVAKSIEQTFGTKRKAVTRG